MKTSRDFIICIFILLSFIVITGCNRSTDKTNDTPSNGDTNTNDPPSVVVSFSDINLETAIREAINKNTGDIFASELQNLTELRASDKQIQTIEGLNHCINITILDLSNNLITNIEEISSLENLTILNLSDNLIIDLGDLAGLSYLKNLELTNNQIDDIAPIASMSSVTDLSLDNNQIADISDFTDNTQMSNGSHISLNNNPLNLYTCDVAIPALLAKGFTLDYECPYIHYSTEIITDLMIKDYGWDRWDRISRYDLSSDGRFVVFNSDNNSDGIYNIFLYDSLYRQTQCITVGTDGQQASGSSVLPTINADGSIVAFGSDADNLVPDDDNGLRDIFIYNRQSENLTRIDIDHAPPETGYVYAGLNDPTISSDGRFVAFYSFYKDQDCDDLYDCEPSYGNLIRYDLFTGEIKQKNIDEHGYYEPVFHGYWNIGYTSLSISGGGGYLAFETEGQIVSKDTNIIRDVYSYDFQAEETIIASVSSDGSISKGYSDCFEGSGCVFAKPCGGSNQASMSDDGQLIVFKSSALKLDEFRPHIVMAQCLDYNGIFVHERKTGEIFRVSINNSGSPANDNNNDYPNISPDGRYVIFNSSATNLVSEPATTLFIHDLQTRKISNLVMDIYGFKAILSNQAKVVLYKSDSGHLIIGKVLESQ